MPKISNKFTAQFTTKIGKTPVEIKIPLDFRDAQPGQSFEDYVAEVQENAANHFSEMVENASLKLKNQGDLKKAHKAFAKANPAPETETEASA